MIKVYKLFFNVMKKKFKEFEGKLNYIKPEHLVTQNSNNETEKIFLILAEVFNDLKGFILFEKMLIENYRQPDNKETSSHAGNYFGILFQIKKLIVSTINEFFVFLKKNNDIFEENEFKEILEKIPQKNQVFWKNMILASNGESITTTGFLKIFLQIRNNIGFHYYQSGKNLKRGYCSYFFGKTKHKRSARAFYSPGETIYDTRFYFSDAAIAEYFQIVAGKKEKENSINNEEFKKLEKIINETVVVICDTISYLLKKYIKQKQNFPH